MKDSRFYKNAIILPAEEAVERYAYVISTIR